MLPARFSPNPASSIDVLAFVLCPAQAFAPDGDDHELAEVREAMLPVKTAAVRRWRQLYAAKFRC